MTASAQARAVEFDVTSEAAIPSVPRRVAATISTPEGSRVAAGVAEFRGPAEDWRATMRDLDRPGNIATMYFAKGLRDVVIRTGDGRSARARITGTTFVVGDERICELRGVEALS